MTVPYPLPVASSWSVVDWLDQTYQAVADSTGVALITIPQLPDTDRWQLTHMVAGCATTASTQMRLYLNDVANGYLRDGTASGNFDVADWPMGLMVPPSTSLLARWTGCNAGDPVFLNVQANILRRSS